MLILKRQAMYVYGKIEARSRSHCCHGTRISINLYVCIHPLVILYTKHMCCIILSSVACLALLYFFTLPHNGTIFEKILNTEYLIHIYIYILIFSTMLPWNISHSKTNSARSYHKRIYIIRYSTVQYPLILWGLNKLEFSRQIFEKSFKH